MDGVMGVARCVLFSSVSGVRSVDASHLDGEVDRFGMEVLSRLSRCPVEVGGSNIDTPQGGSHWLKEGVTRH